MKLRNKKTGEIVEYDSIGFRKGLSYGWEDFISKAESLAELNEVWEDYEPDEQLIKDPKIRNAVRVWAEANDVQRVFVGGFDALMCKCKGIEIDFDGKPFQRIFNEWHDIAELCGEDEE